MAKLCTLFSGSSGNSTYIGTSRGGILIDAGVSARAVQNQMLASGIDMDGVSAIFITHEHGDHIRGVSVLAGRYNIPVYATAGTLSAMEKDMSGKVEYREMNGPLDVAGLSVGNFATSHDSAQSCGYKIALPDGRNIAFCTDLGCITEEVKSALLGCELVVIESNHDLGMLQNGPYPYPTKRRIMSDFGHLSNNICSEFLPELLKSGTTRFVLAHLSRDNNFPQLAAATSRASLEMAGAQSGVDFVLSVAAPSVADLVVI